MTEQQRKEMDKLQADAIKRMREMSSKGQKNNYAPDFLKMKTDSNRETKIEEKPIIAGDEKINGSSKGFNLLKMLNLNNFKMDSDFTVIIAMILLLSSEESDEILLLALLYIML